MQQMQDYSQSSSPTLDRMYNVYIVLVMEQVNIHALALTKLYVL